MFASHGYVDIALTLFIETVANFQQHGIMECLSSHVDVFDNFE